MRRVRQALLLLEAGGSPNEVQKQLGLNALPGQRAVPAGARVQRAGAGAAVVRLARLDEAIKGGSRLDPRLELELALVEISAE